DAPPASTQNIARESPQPQLGAITLKVLLSRQKLLSICSYLSPTPQFGLGMPRNNKSTRPAPYVLEASPNNSKMVGVLGACFANSTERCPRFFSCRGHNSRTPSASLFFSWWSPGYTRHSYTCSKHN